MPAGRPIGAIAAALISAVSERPMPARELARVVQIPEARAWTACSRLVQAGRLVVLRAEMLPGARKPAAIYGLASEPRDDRPMDLLWGRP